MYKTMPQAMLHVGMVLSSPIRDRDGNLLLGAGITITEKFLFGIFKRGICSVAVAESDWIRLAAFSSQGKATKALPNRSAGQTEWNRQSTKEFDKALLETPSCDIVPSENPFFQQAEYHGTTRYDPQRMDRVLQQHQQSVDLIGKLLQQIAEGRTVAADVLHKLSLGFLMRAAEDLDLFVCMGINPVVGDSIFAHSTNVATLAIAIGATLGLDEETLVELGIGCLLHDAGMLQIRGEIYKSKHVLSEWEFAEITKHPIISCEMLSKHTDRLPLGVRMVVYQTHERCNGSGYPRGWKADRIHPLAKIAAVADTYVALVSDRPHRPAMLPYHAMKKVLEDVHDGLYEPSVVRGLLHTIALFPVGSYVELSNSQLAKVIRANGPAYDRPIVEALHRKQLTEAVQVVDLMEADLRVVKPLAALSA